MNHANNERTEYSRLFPVFDLRGIFPRYHKSMLSEYLPAGRQVGKIKPLICYVLSDTQGKFINKYAKGERHWRAQFYFH
jgi:hypothetical protein